MTVTSLPQDFTLAHCGRDRRCRDLRGGSGCGAWGARLGQRCTPRRSPQACSRLNSTGPVSASIRRNPKKGGQGPVPTAGETGPPVCGRRCGVACRQPNHHNPRTSRGASNSHSNGRNGNGYSHCAARPARNAIASATGGRTTAFERSVVRSIVAIAYLVSGVPGWRVPRMTDVYDLADPAKPVKIRDFGLPGQQLGAGGPVPTRLHGAISTGSERQPRLIPQWHQRGRRSADRRSRKAADWS